jgi:hypothetical protein
VGKDDCDVKGDRGGPAQHEPDNEGNERFAEQKDHTPRKDRVWKYHHQPEIYLHAHCDEEQADKDVAEWSYIVLDAVLKVAPADHHAGNEGANRQSQTSEMSEIGGPESNEKRRQEKQVVRAGPGSTGKNSTDERARDDGDRDECNRRKPETPHEIERIDRCLPRPAIHGDEKGDRRDILKQ